MPRTKDQEAKSRLLAAKAKLADHHTAFCIWEEVIVRTPTNMETGRKARYARECLSLTAQDVGDYLGICVSSICELEQGRRGWTGLAGYRYANFLMERHHGKIPTI